MRDREYEPSQKEGDTFSITPVPPSCARYYREKCILAQLLFTASYDDCQTVEAILPVTWQEPPTRGKGVWVRKLEPLMERPGEWALVETTPTERRAYNLHGLLSRRKVLVPDGEWEFKSTKTEEGGEVYARYLGPQKETAVVAAV